MYRIDEETLRSPGLIFGMLGYFWPCSDKFQSWKKNLIENFQKKSHNRGKKSNLEQTTTAMRLLFA